MTDYGTALAELHERGSYGYPLCEMIGFLAQRLIRGHHPYNHDRPNMALGGITPKQRLAMAA